MDDTSGQTKTLNELSASVEIDAEVVEDYGDTTAVFESFNETTALDVVYGE